MQNNNAHIKIQSYVIYKHFLINLIPSKQSFILTYKLCNCFLSFGYVCHIYYRNTALW